MFSTFYSSIIWPTDLEYLASKNVYKELGMILITGILDFLMKFQCKKNSIPIERDRLQFICHWVIMCSLTNNLSTHFKLTFLFQGRLAFAPKYADIDFKQFVIIKEYKNLLKNCVSEAYEVVAVAAGLPKLSKPTESK